MTPGPVQIIGCPRSGTSALSWALHAHSDFFAGPESDFLWHLFGAGKLRSAYDRARGHAEDGWLAFYDVSFDEFCRELGKGVAAVFASRGSGKRWVDSTPAHTLLAEDLGRLLPDMKFLHIVRDGREVVASMLASGFDEEWAADFEQACRTWVHYVEAGVRAEKALGRRVLRVHHSGLVNDAELECGRILRFLGASPNVGPAAFLQNNRVNSSHGATGRADFKTVRDTASLRQPKWQDWSPRVLDCFWQIAGGTMEQLFLAFRPDRGGSDAGAREALR